MGWSVQVATKATLDCFFVDDFEDIEDLIDFFAFWLESFVLGSHGACRRELLGEISFVKVFIFQLFLKLACNSPVPAILAYIVFFVHKLLKVTWIHISLKTGQDLLQLWIVFILHVGPSNTHLFLHLRVILRHEFLHLIHDIVLPLSLNRLLIILQLSREQISLSFLEPNGLLLCLHLIYNAIE